MKRLIRRIERFVITNICLSMAISFAAGVVLATPVFVALLHYVVLPGAVAEMEMHTSIAEGKKLIRLMAADDGKRKCIEAGMIRGQLVCLQQGGK